MWASQGGVREVSGLKPPSKCQNTPPTGPRSQQPKGYIHQLRFSLKKEKKEKKSQPPPMRSRELPPWFQLPGFEEGPPSCVHWWLLAPTRHHSRPQLELWQSVKMGATFTVWGEGEECVQGQSRMRRGGELGGNCPPPGPSTQVV